MIEGFDVINVGSDTHHTILDLLEEIFRAVGWRPGVIRSPLDKPVGVMSRAADVANCRDRMGWVPLRQGVERTLDLEAVAPREAKTFERLRMERN